MELQQFDYHECYKLLSWIYAERNASYEDMDVELFGWF